MAFYLIINSSVHHKIAQKFKIQYRPQVIERSTAATHDHFQWMRYMAIHCKSKLKYKQIDCYGSYQINLIDLISWISRWQNRFFIPQRNNWHVMFRALDVILFNHGCTYEWYSLFWSNEFCWCHASTQRPMNNEINDVHVNSFVHLFVHPLQTAIIFCIYWIQLSQYIEYRSVD